mgnify:CR=1 FL=1
MRIKIIALAFAFMAFSAWSQCCGRTPAASAPKPSCQRVKKAEKAKCTTCKQGKVCSACKAKHSIDTKALKKAIESKEKLVILDARSAKFDDGRRIPGAKQLTSSASAEKVAAVAGSDKDAKIITYCSSLKCGASAKLAKKLRKAGYTNVIEYPRGIAGWAEAGNSVKVIKK